MGIQDRDYMKCLPDDDAERLKTARQDSGVARPSLFPRVILCVLLLAWIAGSGCSLLRPFALNQQRGHQQRVKSAVDF